MTIKIDKDVVVGVGFVLVAGALVAAAVYSAVKSEKALKEHKADVLKDRDLTSEMENASVSNEDFDKEDRVKAYEVLHDAYHKIKNSATIKDFDKNLAMFDHYVRDFTCKDYSMDKRLSRLIIYHDRLKKATHDAEVEKNRLVELEKAKKIANSIDSLSKTLKLFN